MTELTLSVNNVAGEVLASVSGQNEVWLTYGPQYQPGDRLCLRCGEADAFLIVQLDDAMSPAFVYCKEGKLSYPVPFGEDRRVFSERAFAGEKHYLHARMARREEIAARKNLALNPWAAHQFDGAFPFASANVETRGEAVFAARNAIDGYKANDSHGGWPYTSWGINRDPKAALRVDFGRLVELDEAVVYLRADFPHDAWWEEGTLHFSDGSQVTVKLEKTAAGQSFSFPPRKVEWVVLDSLIKADDPSPFPALTQLELWGSECGPSAQS